MLPRCRPRLRHDTTRLDRRFRAGRRPRTGGFSLRRGDGRGCTSRSSRVEWRPRASIISYLCVLTVRVESDRFAAISFMRWPLTINRSTSRCRGVRCGSGHARRAGHQLHHAFGHRGRQVDAALQGLTNGGQKFFARQLFQEKS